MHLAVRLSQTPATQTRRYVTVLALRIAVVGGYSVGPPEPVQGAVKRMQREQGADGRKAGGGLPGGPARAHPRSPRSSRVNPLFGPREGVACQASRCLG